MAGKTSTGCRTCVKRRVKCDETKPVCLRCRKSNRHCSGYAAQFIFRQTVFVNEPPRSVFPQNRPSSQEKDLDQGSESAQTCEKSPESASSLECIQPVPQTIALTGFANNLYSSFLVNTYWASNNSIRDHAGTNRRWFMKCLTEEADHPTSFLALEALAMAYFGRKHRQNQIVLGSNALYGRALRALSQNIQDTEKVSSFDTLAAVATLSLFEYCTPTTSTAYIRHTSALSHILEFRGPAAFSQYPEKAILQTQRALIIIQAIGARRRTFLGSPEWLAIHEEDMASSHSHATVFDVPLGKILNIFAIAPGVMEDIEMIHQQRIFETLGIGTVDLQLLENTTASMMGWLDALERWRQNYGPLFAKCCWESATPMQMTRDPVGPFFDSILWYDSLEAANTWILYNTLSVFALEQSYILHNPSYSLDPVFLDNPLAPYLTAQYFASRSFEDLLPSIVPIAHAIIRSIEYLLQPMYVSSGAFYAMLPARLAYTALRKERRECRWLKRVVERIADEGGLDMAKNLLSDDFLEVVRREKWRAGPGLV
ncbi:MAG: hypothetical protein M1821_009098 [Bathelium mastoideum]|nr:MAG: hypothetical protein M1821_009098 [Bathelium mastoideum]